MSELKILEGLKVHGDLKTTGTLSIASGNSGSDTIGIVGESGNGNIKVRHLEGKDHDSTDYGPLYLNYYSGQNVLIGASGNGRLGVGTQSPAGILDLHDAGTAFARIYSSDGNTARLDLQSAGNSRYSISSLASDIFFLYNETGGQEIARYQGGTSKYWAFRTDNTERLRITNTGNVGIGTTSPSAKLDVSGTVAGDVQLKVGNGSTDTSAKATLKLGTAGGNWFIENRRNGGKLVFVEGSSDVVTMDGGKVGIGTSSPAVKLHVEDTGSQIASTGFYYNTRISDDTNAGLLLGHNNTANGAGMIAGLNEIAFLTYSGGWGERMRLSAAGSLGIGTNTPSEKLDVVGNIELTQHLKATGNNLSFSAGGNQIMNIDLNGKVYPSTHNSYDLGFSSTLAWRNLYVENVYANGNVGIGTTSPSHKVDIYSNSNVPLRIHRPSNANLNSSGAWGIGFSTRNDAATSTTDTRAGIFSYYNGGLFLATAGSSIISDPDAYARLTVLNTGKVGIGTMAPTRKLAVAGAIELTVADTNLHTAHAAIRRGSGGEMFLDAPGHISVTIDTNNNNTDRYFNVRKDSGSELFRVQENGNVGIGVTSATNKLQVNGQIYSHSNIFAAGTIGNKSTNKGINFETPSESAQTARIDSDRFRLYFGGTGGVGETITFNEDGRIGVNTTSPHAGTRMQICGSDTTPSLNTTAIDDTSLVISNSDDDYGMVFATDGSGKGYIQQRRTATATYYDLLLQPHGGSVGINTTSPGAKLDVQPASNGKITKFGNDVMTQYKMTGLSNHTLTLTCGSYYQAEVIITANQTNGGDYNNLYIRGIWHNNHESHHWEEIEHIGELSGSSFTITVSQNTTSNSGKLVIQHNYSSASFAQAVIRVTDFYNTHSYTLT